MDQSLKQRLLGVVIVTALAAIFVPMLFDDPVDESASAISELRIPPSPAEEIVAEIEPPPESASQVLELRQPDYVMAEDELDEINTEPEPVAVVQEAEQAVVQVPVTPAPKIQQAQETQSPTASADSGQWIIQAASLSTRQRAVTLRDNLIKQGYNASYDAFKNSANKTFYRVRIGPIASREQADRMKPLIDKKNFVDSRVMKQ